MPAQEPAAEWVAITDLTPWESNPRKNDKAVDEVAKSIKRFGFAAPIVARLADSKVIAGHTRLKAAQKLGLDKVPVRYVDLSESEAHALALADNKVGELADWDDNALREILAGLDAHGTDISGLGWSDSDLEDLVVGFGGEESTGDDEVPEVQAEAVSKLGEVYELGPHRLVCGDCLDESLYGGSLPDRFDLVNNDPPYGVSERTDRKAAGRGYAAENHDFEPVIGDDSTDTAIRSTEIAIGLATTTIAWGANHFADSRFAGPSWIAWDKRDGVAGDDNADCELAWSNRGGPARCFHHLWKGMIKASERGEARVHPTQKPAALAEWCIRDYPREPAKTVLDMFGGSGSTLIGAAKAGATAYLVELSPAYCDAIRRRWTKWATENGHDPGPGALA